MCRYMLINRSSFCGVASGCSAAECRYIVIYLNPNRLFDQYDGCGVINDVHFRLQK
jgi:hypothetical protein